MNEHKNLYATVYRDALIAAENELDDLRESDGRTLGFHLVAAIVAAISAYEAYVQEDYMLPTSEDLAQLN